MRTFLLLAIMVSVPWRAIYAQPITDSIRELQQVIIEAGTRYKIDDPSPSLRTNTPIIQLPQNIQVVSSQTLRDQQSFDMLEGVTRNISGAARIDSWDTYANITMRGTSITPFRNGMNVKMPWGPILEDFSMVDRIEFVKGPAGFLLANGEPTGLYNVVTKKPTGITKGEATVTLGSFDQYRTTLDLDGKLSQNGKLLYRFNIMGQLKNSHRDFDFNNRYSIVPVLTYVFNDKTTLTAEYTYQYMKMAMIGSSYIFSPKKYGELPRSFSLLEPNLDPTHIKDHSFYLTLNHQLETNWKLTTQVAYFNFSQTGASMWPAYPVGLTKEGILTRSVANWDAFNEARLGQAFINGEFATGPVNHKVLGGLDMAYKNYYADFYQTANLTGYDIYGTSVPFNIYDPVHGFVPASDLPKFDRSLPLRQRGGATLGESSSSLYLQDEIHLIKNKLRLTVAGRYTKLKQHSYGTYSTDKEFTPRAGVSFSVDKQTSLYALYDKAFVAQQGADSSNKPFVPVTGNNMEAGIKRDWHNGKWNSIISVYQIIRNNVISVVPGPEYKTIQTGQTKTKGVELDVRGEIIKSLNLIFNCAYTHSRITKDEDDSKIGTRLTGSAFPDHISNAWMSYRFHSGKLKGFGASLGYQYQGKREESLPDYFRLDGNISWQGNQYSISLNANNLLNDYLYMGYMFEHNSDPSSPEYNYQVEAGTNLRLAFSYRF